MSDERERMSEDEIMERVIQHFRETPVAYWEARIKQYMWEAEHPSPDQDPFWFLFPRNRRDPSLQL